MSADSPRPEFPDEESDRADVDVDAESEELSLDQLSEAYAKVLREKGAASKADPADSSPLDLAESDPEPGVEADLTNQLESEDADDNAGCPISPETIVEAMLFVGTPAGEKLTARKLADVMRDVSPTDVKAAVKRLNQSYDQQNAAFRIVDESGSLQLKLCENLAEVQNHFFGRNRAVRLSQGAIDVLAIVAYNQPIDRVGLNRIRGRSSGSILNQLRRRNLIAIDESSDTTEKQFVTTDRFLELFGLDSVTDLPQTSVVTDLEELADL